MAALLYDQRHCIDLAGCISFSPYMNHIDGRADNTTAAAMDRVDLHFVQGPCRKGTCYHVHDGHAWSRCWRQPDRPYDHCGLVENYGVQRPDQVRLSVESTPPPAQQVDLYTSVMASSDDRHTTPPVRSVVETAASSRTVSPMLSWDEDQSTTIEKPSDIYHSPVRTPSISTLSSNTTCVDSCETPHYPTTIPQVKDYSKHIANAIQLQAYQNFYPLPPISNRQRLKEARYRALSFYRRLMISVLLINIAVIAAMVAATRMHLSHFTYGHAATAVGANLLATALMRQEHVINLLFHLACAIPTSAPLSMRRIATKMAYNNGGVHSGSAISALLWYIFYTVLLAQQFQGTAGTSRAIFAITGTILIIFTILIVLAHPIIRRKHHDFWELSHRFGGWTAVGLVWAQILIVAISSVDTDHQPLGKIVTRLPTFWFLIVITCCLVYPWLRLKRLPVHATRLSDHATQLHFSDRTLPTCRGIRLAHNPVLECHGFATIPNPPPTITATNLTALPNLDAEKGYSVVVSRAGDFTTGMIQNPPRHIWARGAPTTGVMRLSSLFKPIVVVATGSGIGPCLSFLNVNREHPMRIIWSARWPEKTYGPGIMENVLAADCNALIIDTKNTGTPNLVALTYACVKEMRAEAVMIISNPKVTQEVVFGMEARKIAAFGAIFDS